MSAVELASRLGRLGVSLWAEGGSLRYRAPQGVMTAELRAEVAASKGELLELLDSAASPRPAAIVPVPRDGTAPLSFAQERLWFTEQLEPGSALFTIDAAVRLRFPVDRRALQLAFDEMLRRHEALRTTFRDTADGPVQVIAPELQIVVGDDDLRTLPPADREPRARAMAEEQAREPFDLTAGPLVRARLAQLGPADYLLVLTIHHIVSDGWSMGIFWRELAAWYEQFAGGRPAELPPLPIQYGDFAMWQRRQLDRNGLRSQLSYWRQRLANAPALELPTDHPRPAAQRFRGRHARFSVPAAVVGKLAALAQQHGATPFIVYLAAFQALLARYSGQDDIVIGSYHANRNHTEVEGLIGFFVNTLVFRGDLSGDPAFAELVGRMREVALGAYANQDVPFARLVEELAPRRDPSRNPIFQVVFQLFNAPTIEQPREGAEPPLAIERGTAAFDLVVSLWQAGEGLGGDVEYDCDLFEADSIDRMVGHLNRLLAGAAEDPQRRISELPLLDDEERRRVLHEPNLDVHAVDVERGVVARFSAQVAQRPAEVAFRHAGREVSYAELDRQVRAVLAALRGSGVGREDVVGVCVDRSPEAVAAILGILAAGAAWLPLDPSYPAERLRFMIGDAAARVVLARGPVALGVVRGTAAQVLDLDGLAEDRGADVADVVPAGSDLAYVIYTSGSTGTPKGVAVEHGQVLNRLEWMWRRFPFQPGEVGCQKTALSFVDSIWEMFGPLLQGVPTAILDEETVRDPVLLVGELARHGVTRLWLVPGALRAILDACHDLPTRLPRLRFWVSTGEPMSRELFDRFGLAYPDATLHNCYGASEFWDATWYDPRADGRPAADDRVPIGRPISNLRTYVLDRHRQPVPIGVPGELYVGGLGLARGYLGRPELTAKRFVPDPFARRSGARMLATGDRARLRANGELEYLSRLDAQLKVRGLRIEPAEVEDALARHPAVRECAVRLEPAGNEEMLVGYVEARQNHPAVSAEELRRFLRARLPEPMVPGRFLVVDRLPRTPSGKVDRSAISAPAPEDSPAADRISPRTALEQLVAAVWASVLGLPEVGVTDSFFDLGGHSLLGTQVVGRLRATLDVELPLRRLFEGPTVADLAAAIREDPDVGSTVERRAELIMQLSELSDDQVAQLLAQSEDDDGNAASRLG